MGQNYLMLELDGDKANSIAEVITNKTCKKILNLLAEKELSESDIAISLKIPLNTVHYNVQKLVDSGLIEKSKKFFWSVKGKKINTYGVSNKKILISPKRAFKGVVPAIVASALIAFGLKIWAGMREAGFNAASNVGDIGEKAVQTVSSGAFNTSQLPYVCTITSSISNLWAWFLIGALSGLFIFLLWNWIKR